jgi:rare lipoprotein A (peptidoglycan hydrolase)
MKDLMQIAKKRIRARQILLAGLASLVFFAAGRSTAKVDTQLPVYLDGQGTVQPVLFTQNRVVGTKPVRSFVCLSSWYGEDFDGQLTANGEIYDMYAHTAAHPTLPLGSVVRVVNLRTRKSTIVRINDRGPYIPGRDLDVSYEVARELGFVRRGTARVRVELLKVPPSKATPATN